MFCASELILFPDKQTIYYGAWCYWVYFMADREVVMARILIMAIIHAHVY